MANKVNKLIHYVFSFVILTVSQEAFSSSLPPACDPENCVNQLIAPGYGEVTFNPCYNGSVTAMCTCTSPATIPANVSETGEQSYGCSAANNSATNMCVFSTLSNPSSTHFSNGSASSFSSLTTPPDSFYVMCPDNIPPLAVYGYNTSSKTTTPPLTYPDNQFYISTNYNDPGDQIVVTQIICPSSSSSQFIEAQ